jgi:hypothetical protein
MPMNELGAFLETWDREAENTLKLWRVLPVTQYDFRPDPGGRSLGELAWHLAEGDSYISYGIERGQFTMDAKPPNIERPRTIEGLAPGYERTHREAVARIRTLTPADLDRSMPFFWWPEVDSKPVVGRDRLARHPSPRAADGDLSSRRRPCAGAVRAQSRGDRGTSCRRTRVLNPRAGHQRAAFDRGGI